jgi:hypothetical protein
VGARPLSRRSAWTGAGRGSPGIEKHLLYVALTDTGQEMFTPEEFSQKHGWKNDADKMHLVGD